MLFRSIAEKLSEKAIHEFVRSGRPLSIGNDIVEVQRIARLMDRRGSHFIERCFTATEIDYCRSKNNPAVHFAGRWAAKEAVYKALQLKWNRPFSWKEIEIAPAGPAGNPGPPKVNFTNKLRDSLSMAAGAESVAQPRILVSISHCSNYAFATALALYDEVEEGP